MNPLLLLQPKVFRLSPERHEYRDAASQTLPEESFAPRNKLAPCGSAGSIRSTSTGAPSTVLVRNSSSHSNTRRSHKAYDYRRMTESLWSPPPQATGQQSEEKVSLGKGKDGGHLWNRKMGRGGLGAAGRADTVTSNEGRTMSSVGGCDLEEDE